MSFDVLPLSYVPSLSGVTSSRSAVKHLLKSVVREICTLRSVGTGGGRPPPVTRWVAPRGVPLSRSIDTMRPRTDSGRLAGPQDVGAKGHRALVPKWV